MTKLLIVYYIIISFFFEGITGVIDLQEKILNARDKVLPALVHIEPVKSFFSNGERRHTLVTGSGFIFSPEGYVLTNHHVVENAERVDCTLFNKKKLLATVIGSDPSTDVAVIQLKFEEDEPFDLKFSKLGNSDNLEVGQIVLALGSPLGLSKSVSMGVVSSIDRYFEEGNSSDSPYNLWIQTDAAINPGNSGGPLINLKGEVVGINSRAVFLAENLGFAIPINLAQEIAEKLIAGEKINRSWIGVMLQPIKHLKEYLNEPSLRGVLVSNVEILSPAEKTGVKAGDVIVAINDININAEFEEDLPEIRKIIANLPLKDKIKLKLWQKNSIKEIELYTEVEPYQFLPEFECEKWGFVAKSLNQNIFRIHSLPDYDGVYISAVKSGEIAEHAGLRGGDVIRTLNKQKVTNLEDFQKIYLSLVAATEKQIFIEVIRQGAMYYAVLNIEDF